MPNDDIGECRGDNIWLLLLIFVDFLFNYKIIPEQFTAIGPPSFIWRGGGGAKKVRDTFIPVYIHIHIQYQTLKSNISKTGQDREKVSMEVR